MYPMMISTQNLIPSQVYLPMQQVDVPPATDNSKYSHPQMVVPSSADSNSKYAKIQDGLEGSLSFEGKTRISKILGDIRQLTDVEKLLLYLKLPSGVVQDDQTRLTPPSCLPSSSRREQGEAATWIRSHLEEHGDVCMPKAEVYDEYRQYCDQHDLRALCNADFGKMMKQVFPEINTRRLGQRGQSKYFYGGLRKKMDHAQPTLPELEIHSKNMEIDNNAMTSELFRASCQLVCEWADKLLEARFSSVQAVAEHLVTNLYVNTKSGQAFTLIAAMQERGSDNLKGSALFASQLTSCGDKHKETNLLLQQKLHKNKLLQKQKEKLQAMKEEVEQQKTSTTAALPNEPRAPSIPPTRKSTTPSRSAKTPKLPSPSPSPVPMQSPRKLHSKHDISTSYMVVPSQMTPVSLPGPPRATSACSDTSTSYMVVPSQIAPVLLSGPPRATSACSSMQVVTQQTKNETTNIGIVEKRDISSDDLKLSGHVKHVNNTAGVGTVSAEYIPHGSKGRKSVTQRNNSSEMLSDVAEGKTDICDTEHSSVRQGVQREIDKLDRTDSEDVVFVKFEKMDQRPSAGCVEITEDRGVVVNDAQTHSGNTAETPYSEMETDHVSTNHVRKIDFENMVEKTSVAMEQSRVSVNRIDSSMERSRELVSVSVNRSDRSTDLGKTGTLVGGHGKQIDNIAESAKIAKDILVLKEGLSNKTPNFSKSAGHSGLKKLLEGNHQSSVCLNKSHGSLEISKNTLFVNQSKIQGGSAFVPFSKVPCRKGIPSTNPPPNSIPIFIPSSLTQNPQKQTDIFTFEAVSQPASIAMIAVPSSLAAGHLDLGPTHQRLPDNIIKILPSPTSAVHMSTASNTASLQSVSAQANQPVSVNLKSVTKETSTIATPSTAVSMMSGSESVTSASSSVQISPNVPKHMKTRFTPIRPKASPNKSAPVREAPTYDKRPVSTILKEKRAKEQAEAAAKLQANVKVPTIPFQPNVLSRGSLTSIHSMAGLHATAASNIPANEVVIIVNSQSGTASVPGVTNPAATVTQPLTAPDQIIMPNCVLEDQKENQHVGIEKRNELLNEGETLMDACTAETMEVAQVRNNYALAISEKTDSSSSNSSIETGKNMQNADAMMIDTAANEDEEEAWSETPVKIAKLNVTSPNRSESACSLGRETPIKVVKMSDTCLSRPESACSYGRETPSGARKRKSSDLHSKRNFKRLNSTGEDGDETASSRPRADVLSPGMDMQLMVSQRRTQSCTLEIDKDMKISQQPKIHMTLPEGLQKPDISSLEREALIESFPNSLYMMRPHKMNRQTSSVGVNAKSLRTSQQQFIKQQQYLDQRVKNFLKESSTGSSMPQPVSSSAALSGKVREQRSDQKNSPPHGVAKDSATVANKPNASNVRFEPSGLPTDVADWINETILKRQEENQSALSEPDLGVLNQRPASVSDVVVPNFNFQVDGGSSSHKDRVKLNTPSSVAIDENCKQNTAGGPPPPNLEPTSSHDKVQANNPFTVPRVPAVSSRVKDHASRVSLDLPMNSQRCQSLPTFTSPVQSPLSPVTSNRAVAGLYQRATSMSPRGQYGDGGQSGDLLSRQSGDLLSPVGTIVSPMRNIDVRDNHPITVNVHPVAGKLREDAALKHGANQVGSYMASLQHNLQKPKESMLTEQTCIKTAKEQSVDKFAISSVNIGIGASVKNPFSRDSANDINMPKLPDRIGSHTISDSGYHSTGPSPVLNSTPVPSIHDFDPSHCGSQKLPISQSPMILSSEYASPIHHISPQESPIQMSTMGPPQNASFSGSRMRLDSGIQLSPLNTSTNSAFVPIQGSPNDIRYVTPIRPTVTLPNSGNSGSTTTGFTSNIFIDPNQSAITSDEIMMVSPKSSQDPPSYEMTMKMRSASIQQEHVKTNVYINRPSDEPELAGVLLGVENNPQINPLTGASTYQTFDIEKRTVADQNKRISLLANMGKTDETPQRNNDQFGPFASKLVQLSQQTKQTPQAKTVSGKSSGANLSFHLSSHHGDCFPNSNPVTVSAMKNSSSAPVLSAFSNNTNTMLSFASGNLPSSANTQQTDKECLNLANCQSGFDGAIQSELLQPAAAAENIHSLLATNQSEFIVSNSNQSDFRVSNNSQSVFSVSNNSQSDFRVSNNSSHSVFSVSNNQSEYNVSNIQSKNHLSGKQCMQQTSNDMDYFQSADTSNSLPSDSDTMLMLSEPVVSATDVSSSNNVLQNISTYIPSNVAGCGEVSRSFPSTILDDKMSIDFEKTPVAQAGVENIDSIIKELEHSSNMRSSEAEFPDQFDLAIETLMEGQYPFEDGLYSSESGQNQQLSDFAMLED